MAYWQRKGRAVYVYSVAAGKPRVLPRDSTRHLDGEPDHNIDAWVANWALAHEALRGVAPTDTLTHAETLRLLGQYLEYLRPRKAPPTLAWHAQMLRQWVLPFFVQGEPPLPDPNQWPSRSIRLLDHMLANNAREAAILRANTATRAFWEWLADEGLVLGGSTLRLRRPVRVSRTTPLPRPVEPGEVLAFAAAPTADPDCRLLALLGYFFSLRPFEAFALRPVDFRAGAAAADLECCRVAARFGLFARMAVHIHRQRVQSGEFRQPKAHSRGWVTCIDERAARALVGLLRGRPAEEVLFRYTPDTLLKRWRASGLRGITLKDLRRASLYWLGHRTTIDFVALRAHARHARPETTLLYLRRPEEKSADWADLDLDA